MSSLEAQKDLLESLNIDETPEYDNMKNHRYERPIEYWLVILGYAVGYGSFWRFPYLVYSCGGGVFLIPFLVFLFLLGIPMFLLESTIGQVFKKGPVEFFEMLRKKFAGIGWAAVLVSWIISVYYAIILCWSVFFFFQSFVSPLPWSREASLLKNNNLSNSTGVESITNDTNEDNYLNVEYFRSEVIKLSDGIENMGSVDDQFMICLIVTYILIFICIFKGIKSSTKVVYFTAPAPVIILFILFLKVITLPGISIGLKYLFLPDLSKLMDINVWIKASNQVIFMISLGIGGTILFSVYRKDNEDLYVSSVWVPILTASFGIFCAIINFCYLGHFSHVIGVPIEKLPLTGIDLAFITYPSVLCTLPYANFWSILFFFMLITLGIDSQFAFNELVSNYFYEYFGFKYFSRITCSLLICFLGFIFGLPLITNGGLYLFQIIDEYATLISCYVIILLEAVLVTRYIGLDVIREMVANKTGRIIPGYIFFCIKYLIPIVQVILIGFSFNNVVSLIFNQLVK